MGENLSRRSFIRRAGVSAAGLTVFGTLAGCASESEVPDRTGEDVAWDKEADLVVVGSGTAIYGAIAAAKGGASVIVVEKAGRLGGTTRLSGCAVWVPQNEHQVDEGFGEDLSEQEIVEYLVAADIYNGTTREDKEDYVKNAASFFKMTEEAWGFNQAVYTVLGDYTDLPGSKEMGRSLIHVDDSGEFLGGNDLYTQKIEPLLEELGIEVLAETEVIELIQDEPDKVVGISFEGGAIKANKGVLLGAGGFDHNPEMRDAYLRGPIFGTSAAAQNTGDGHRMGIAVKASLGNMASVWQCPFYIVDNSGDLSLATDWFEYGGLPGSLTVNSKGKRFTDENTAYGMADLSFYAYDSNTFTYLNMPAYQICDSEHVEYYGWPAYLEEQPEWLKSFDSLEAIAAEYGIDKEGLLTEVERFNTFCETGKDLDWGRGEGAYGQINVAGYMVERPELANPCLAKVATPPFYVAQIAPGSIGTSGGLRTNLDAQVIDLEGNPIEGLYATGNNSAGIFGCAYPGAGATDGAGFYRAVRAANHAIGLNLFS